MRGREAGEARGDRYRVFAELRILKDFKSFVLYLQILKGLQVDFA
jgi:hypothetical protein